MKKSSMIRTQSGTPSEVDAFRDLINGALDYMNTSSIEKTKRQKIKADLELNMELIKAQKQVLEEYLRKTFSEREHVINEMFLRLDRALDENRDEVAIQALASIEGIVKSSPLEALLETRKTLGTPGAVLEI
jgi:hypothetical protein